MPHRSQLQAPEQELLSDPDNVPLRSRLFMVVPKQADIQQIQVRSTATAVERESRGRGGGETGVWARRVDGAISPTQSLKLA